MIESSPFSGNTGKRVADKSARAIHILEDSLAYFSLFFLGFVPFMEVIAREFFKSGLPNSTIYLQHLVLVATFLAGAITSRQSKHLSLALDIPIKEPLKQIVYTAVHVLCAAMTIAFAWSSISFAFNGFDATQKMGIFPLRLVTLVMFLGYLAMGLRFVSGMDYKKRRGLWLLLAFLFGTFLAFTSVVQVFKAFSVSLPAFLASLEQPFQAGLAQAASPLIILIIVSAFFGTPIFVVLGGIGYLLFARQALPLEVIPNQAYSMLTGFSIAAIPLFTLTGFFLSESKAGERLVKLFQAFFSWFPGGLAVMAVFVCAFFTTFTGASGVTIVALGGLLYYILVNSGYGKVFSVGLLTASGSIGLLFPPSLPVIIYGVTAQVNIKEMFKGGILPGGAMVLTMVVIGIVYAAKSKVERLPFSLKETFSAIRQSIWELLLPLVIFIGYFGIPGTLVRRFAVAVVYVLVIEVIIRQDSRSRGLPGILATYIPVSAAFIALFFFFKVAWLGIVIAAAVSAVYGFFVIHLSRPGLDTKKLAPVFFRFILLVAGVSAALALAARVSLTIVESAAVAAIYALIVEVFIHRDLKVKDLLNSLNKSIPIIGGVLTILALANGLSYFIIDAEIPMKLAAWVQATISSKYIFLLILNLALLVVGCFLDIYSAILVVVPLIIPLGNLFQIHPVHLGVIFLANLELGYLTPPVGLNLYLASYRFNEPMVKIFKDVQVFLFLRLGTVLLITYVPLLTTALLQK